MFPTVPGLPLVQVQLDEKNGTTLPFLRTVMLHVAMPEMCYILSLHYQNPIIITGPILNNNW